MVDIGAGANEDGYKIAQELGVSGYIAVEPYYAKRLKQVLKEYIKEEHQAHMPLPLVIIKENGLSALQHLKDGSVNIMSSATDNLILRDKGYNAEANKEMTRVLGDKGLFINYDSVLHPKYHKEVNSINFFHYACPVRFYSKSDNVFNEKE